MNNNFKDQLINANQKVIQLENHLKTLSHRCTYQSNI